MTRPSTNPGTDTDIALCAAMPIAVAGDGGIAEWVHLLPAGSLIETHDGRGPYKVRSMEALAASLKPGSELPVDVNHATDLAAPSGGESPARGWIVELAARGDGLWGRVEWTEAGKALLADKAYRWLSPAIRRTRDNEVLAVLRAGLTNTPNIKGLVALNAEESAMDWKAKLIELLGLDGKTEDAAIVAALSAKLKTPDKKAGDADKPDIHSQRDDQRIVDLQSELGAATSKLADVTGQLDALQGEIKLKDATAFVDAEIRRGRIGLKPVRQDYIDIHMEDPALAAKLIGAMKIMPGVTVAGDVPEGADPVLSDPVLLAQEAGAYQKRLADAGQAIDFAGAVLAVTEGRHK